MAARRRKAPARKKVKARVKKALSREEKASLAVIERAAMDARQNPPIGRPSKLTPERVEILVDALRAGNFENVAARLAGIGERTFHRWMSQGAEPDADEEFRHFRQLVLSSVDHAERTAVEAWRRHFDGDWRAAKEFLQCRYTKQWAKAERQRNGQPATNVTVNTQVNIVEAALDQLDERRQKKLSDDRPAEIEGLAEDEGSFLYGEDGSDE